MQFRSCVLVVIAGLCWAGPVTADDAEDRAVEAIKRLGGQVTRDGAKPGNSPAGLDYFFSRLAHPRRTRR